VSPKTKKMLVVGGIGVAVIGVYVMAMAAKKKRETAELPGPSTSRPGMIIAGTNVRAA